MTPSHRGSPGVTAVIAAIGAAFNNGIERARTAWILIIAADVLTGQALVYITQPGPGGPKLRPLFKT